MFESILIYTIVLLLIASFFIMVYLELFLVRKLYHEICVAKKNIKISSLWGYYKRLKCLRGFSKVEPYAKRVQKAELLYRINMGFGFFTIVLVVIYKLLGYGEGYKECSGTMTEALTITIQEGNKTSVKKYKNLEEFLK